jgi:hypothetical protein
MNRKLTNTLIAVTVAVIQLGCASQPATEAQFGNAVRSVTLNQIHDKGAAVFSNSDAVTGGDPYRLENVVNAHRGEESQQQSGGADSTVEIRSGNR